MTIFIFDYFYVMLNQSIFYVVNEFRIVVGVDLNRINSYLP